MEIKLDISCNLYVIKEREREGGGGQKRAGCHPVSCQTLRCNGHFKVGRKVECFFSVLLEACVAAKESHSEYVTDPRCLICSLTDGHRL